MNVLRNLRYTIPIIFLMTISTQITQTAESTYEETINQYAQEWTQKYISQSCDYEIQTIIDLLLLSYQTIKASCDMIRAKFTIQTELFKIYTPSFIDSWHQNLQIHQNDTSKLEEALMIIKLSQNNLHDIYEKFKKLLPSLVKINPQPTQTLILDLKHLLVIWGKDQHLFTKQLLTVQNELSQACIMMSDVKPLFETISQSSEVKLSYLKDAASFFSKTYKEIDLATDHLTLVRMQGVTKIQHFFEDFFKSYYTTMYQNLTQEQKNSLFLWSTQTQKTVQPDALFA